MTTAIQTPGAQAQIVKPVREVRTVEDSGPLANLFDTARFDHLYRIAGAMSAAVLIPDHLWKNKVRDFTPSEVQANCFLIVNQAVRWGMDPFAVMPETYVVGGKLAYQGKLVAAVINARAGLQGRLKYTFAGTKGKPDFTITVSGKFPDDDEPCTITLSVGDAKTENQMWNKDPEQKLVYSGVVKWARRYCPEIVLGVVTDDDLERMAENANAEGAKTAKAREIPTRPKFEKALPATTAEVAEQAATESALEPTKEPAPAKPEPQPESDTDSLTDIPDPRDTVAERLAKTGIKEIDFLKHLREKHSMSVGSLRELTTDAAFGILDLWEDMTEPLLPPQGDDGAANKETIATALRDMGIAQGPFMQGLAKVHPDASRNWTKVEQMPAEMAAWIIEAGLDTVLGSIRLKGGKL